MPNLAASRLVLGPFSEQLVRDAAHETLLEAGGHVTCGFVFASADYRPQLVDFLELVQLHGHVPILAGCSGSGLIGTGLEAEQTHGFSLLFLNLAQTKVHALHIPQPDAAPGEEKADAWVTLADPVSFPIEPWIDRWNSALPGTPTIGGLASGGARGDDVFLFRDRELVEGAVAIGFSGGVKIHTLVSQGCRPIGEPLTITGAEENFITSLGSRPAYEMLQQTFEKLPDSDKELAQGNIFAGLATSEYVEEFKTGDFLVRNLIGADPHHGVLAVGAYPRVGQTLQFQLRDRRSADAELRHLAAEKRRAGLRPFASLLFCCNGRGRALFGTANHDAEVLRDTFGQHASAGFFCNGEIGPVGGKNFVHGYTASAALFAEVES